MNTEIPEWFIIKNGVHNVNTPSDNFISKNIYTYKIRFVECFLRYKSFFSIKVNTIFEQFLLLYFKNEYYGFKGIDDLMEILWISAGKKNHTITNHNKNHNKTLFSLNTRKNVELLSLSSIDITLLLRNIFNILIRHKLHNFVCNGILIKLLRHSNSNNKSILIINLLDILMNHETIKYNILSNHRWSHDVSIAINNSSILGILFKLNKSKVHFSTFVDIVVEKITSSENPTQHYIYKWIKNIISLNQNLEQMISWRETNIFYTDSLITKTCFFVLLMCYHKSNTNNKKTHLPNLLKAFNSYILFNVLDLNITRRLKNQIHYIVNNLNIPLLPDYFADLSKRLITHNKNEDYCSRILKLHKYSDLFFNFINELMMKVVTNCKNIDSLNNEEKNDIYILIDGILITLIYFNEYNIQYKILSVPKFIKCTFIFQEKCNIPMLYSRLLKLLYYRKQYVKTLEIDNLKTILNFYKKMLKNNTDWTVSEIFEIDTYFFEILNYIVKNDLYLISMIQDFVYLSLNKWKLYNKNIKIYYDLFNSDIDDNYTNELLIINKRLINGNQIIMLICSFISSLIIKNNGIMPLLSNVNNQELFILNLNQTMFFYNLEELKVNYKNIFEYFTSYCYYDKKLLKYLIHIYNYIMFYNIKTNSHVISNCVNKSVIKDMFIYYLFQDPFYFKLTKFKSICDCYELIYFTKNDLDNPYKNDISTQCFYKKLQDLYCTFERLFGIYKSVNEEEEEIELPDEFLDPIMGVEIVTPVVVPNVNVIMEKDVIEKILFENNMNPFTRESLSFHDVLKYNDEIDNKQKCLVFLEKKKTFLEKKLK